MKNLIVVGDSFCASRHLNNADLNYSLAWPNLLADELKLNLLGAGFIGAGWWPVRNALKKFDQEQIDNTEAIVFCHSDAYRLLNSRTHQNTLRYGSNLDINDEEQLAVKLYYKYILEDEFAEWAQQMWLYEISNTYEHLKLIHLYCFPWTLKNIKSFPTGISVFPALSSISLNEFDYGLLDRKQTIIQKLANDKRDNHLSAFNNKELARQLTEIIRNYSAKNTNLDVSKFQLKTTRWFDIDFWDLK
jgi:hypothetical protein